jgi:hypothetical protein
MLFQKQTLDVVSQDFGGPIGITASLAGPTATIPGAPYSAQAVTQHVQVLSDGNRITHTTTNNVARDSKGRVYREESLPGLDSNSEPPHLVLIEDPIAGQHITLNSNSKTAFRTPVSQTKKADEAAARAGVPPPGQGIVLMFDTAGSGQPQQTVSTMMKIKADDEKAATTDLGKQTIEGVVAQGTKITRTIPAGDMGNDLPIVITTETWYSPDLKVLVMSKSTDPRMGETTYKLTNLSRTEPDPSMFQIPSDYTVKDQPDKVFFIRDTQ